MLVPGWRSSTTASAGTGSGRALTRRTLPSRRERHQGAGWYRGRVNLGPTELIIILLVVLVLFGGAKLPKLARSLGQAQTEFKKGLKETPEDDDEGRPTA